MWRPKDWNNPYKDTDIDSPTQAEDYEDGADAMLKALRGQAGASFFGFLFDITVTETRTGKICFQAESCSLSNKGSICFIPDDNPCPQDVMEGKILVCPRMGCNYRGNCDKRSAQEATIIR